MPTYPLKNAPNAAMPPTQVLLYFCKVLCVLRLQLLPAAGVKLCLLISGSERDAQFWFEDIRLRLRHTPSTEEHSAADEGASHSAAEEQPAKAHAADHMSEADSEYVLELLSMWPCRTGTAGVKAVPQEGAMYSHAPWLDGS